MRGPKDYGTDIEETLCQLWSRFRGGDPEWTRATFEALRDLGERHGFESRYSPKAGGPGESLWDFVWLQRDQSERIVAMPLAAESEWGKLTLRRDFEKLLFAGAQLRLVILQVLTDEQFQKTVSELRELSFSYQGPPAVFLSAGWVYGGQAPHACFESWAAPAT